MIETCPVTSLPSARAVTVTTSPACRCSPISRAISITPFLSASRSTAMAESYSGWLWTMPTLTDMVTCWPLAAGAPPSCMGLRSAA